MVCTRRDTGSPISPVGLVPLVFYVYAALWGIAVELFTTCNGEQCDEYETGERVDLKYRPKLGGRVVFRCQC